MIRNFKKISTDDVELQKVQENLSQWAQPITMSQVIDGNLLKGIVLTTGQTTLVDHKLGRELLGYIVIGKSSNSSVWDSQAANLFKSRNLALECSANTIVDLWVF